MMPFLPHFTSECLNELSVDPILDKQWPKIDSKSLKSDKINLVVQINGKKRDVLELKNDSSKIEIMNAIQTNEKISKFLKDKKIIKKIFIPNRLVNLIIG